MEIDMATPPAMNDSGFELHVTQQVRSSFWLSKDGVKDRRVEVLMSPYGVEVSLYTDKSQFLGHSSLDLKAFVERFFYDSDIDLRFT